MSQFPVTAKEAFELRDGKLFWKTPPWNKPNLLGREAGFRKGSRGKYYWTVTLEGIEIQRSRVVYFLTRGHWSPDEVDHKDGDSLNDSPSNLRAATHLQNSRNVKRYKKSNSLPMGVRQRKDGKYVARITVNKQQLWLGSFAESTEAAETYRRARAHHFGEFA